jgi:hypothetical protein
MLAVEKERVLVETAREVAALREAELRYYVEHIGGVQTMATLLAGFAFTALVSMDTVSLSRNAFFLLQSSGKFEVTPHISDSDNSTASGVSDVTPKPAEPADGALPLNCHRERSSPRVSLEGRFVSWLHASRAAFTLYSFSAHAIEVLLVVLCLGEVLHVMTETLISRQLGSRLALRGPDGSIITATYLLAASLARATRRFFSGLQ